VTIVSQNRNNYLSNFKKSYHSCVPLKSALAVILGKGSVRIWWNSIEHNDFVSVCHSYQSAWGCCCDDDDDDDDIMAAIAIGDADDAHLRADNLLQRRHVPQNAIDVVRVMASSTQPCGVVSIALSYIIIQLFDSEERRDLEGSLEVMGNDTIR